MTLVTESSTANTAFQANEYDMYWVGLANPTILQQLDGAGIYVKEDNQNGMGVESLGLIPNSAIDGPWPMPVSAAPCATPSMWMPSTQHS